MGNNFAVWRYFGRSFDILRFNGFERRKRGGGGGGGGVSPKFSELRPKLEIFFRVKVRIVFEFLVNFF